LPAIFSGGIFGTDSKVALASNSGAHNVSRLAIPKWYSTRGLWTLFLACVFPQHVWTFILAFSDFSWVAKRTNSWDAIGVMSYGLLWALFESLIVCAAAALLGVLISTKWDESRRIALLSVLVLVLSAWSMYNQAYFLWGVAVPEFLIRLASSSARPLRALYLSFLLPVLATVAAPTLLILQRERPFRVTQGLFERISLLSAFYLIFDAAGLIIVISRNI